MATVTEVDAIIRSAFEWLVVEPPPDASADSSLYSGESGVVLALVEADAELGAEDGDRRWAEAAIARARQLAAASARVDGCSLHFGSAGIAFALHAIGDRYDDPVCRAAAQRRLVTVRSGFDGERWNPFSELLIGNAGIGLGALAAGDLDLALLAVEPYLRWADETPDGVN